MVGRGVGGGSRRSGEEEAGGLGQEAARRSGCCVSRDWRCECVCVWYLLELIAKAMTPDPSCSGGSIGYEWARH